MNGKSTANYGYFDGCSDRETVSMRKGQNIAGHPVGIIYIEDVWYPMVPGNIVNGYTFDFPVRLMPVEGLDIENLFTTAKGVEEAVIEACRKLEREGCRAISSACGFFGNYHKAAAAAVDVPVALSSLVQIPWIMTLLRPGQQIGVLTASKGSFSDKLLRNCGISSDIQEKLIVKDLEHEPEFSCILEGRGSFNNAVVRREVVGKAEEIANEGSDVGAILLECSDMPPYAAAIQDAVGLPVFDFTTLIRWLHNAVAQVPYKGLSDEGRDH